MNNSQSEKRYRELFPDDQSKAAAFDLIADRYFDRNFGTLQKAEMDLLLFSMYLNRLYESENFSDADVSDHALANELCITQGRVRSLKERQELKYPSEGFDWKVSFRDLVGKAECEGGKIKLYIRDQRLYTQLCNIVEDQGNYAEVTLTRKLLVVSPPAFVDLMLAAETEADEAALRRRLKDILEENQVDVNGFLEGEETFREALKDEVENVVSNVLEDVVSTIPFAGGTLARLIPSIRRVAHAYSKQRKATAGDATAE